jgi:O-acetyl-ADP-ribose deacetylase (regulator of RNase III)
MKIVQGDLLAMANDGKFDVIVHGCNCFCTMGAGIAKSIKHKFPAAYEADLRTQEGDPEKLGTYTSAVVPCQRTKQQHRQTLTIINAYTQYYWKPREKRVNGRRKLMRPVNYDAIRLAFRNIKQEHSGKRLAYPKIGAGLAGGNWEIIYRIIDEELDGEDHTLVVYQELTTQRIRTQQP